MTVIRWRRPQEPATDPGREAPSRSEGSSRGRDVSRDAGRVPPPAPEQDAAGRMASVTLDAPGSQITRLPRPARVALVLALMAVVVNVALDLLLWSWLRLHPIGHVLIALASMFIALASGAAELVIPVPRAQPAVWPPAELSLLCWLQRDRTRNHKVCHGTTDDGRDAPCGCWCHERG